MFPFSKWRSKLGPGEQCECTEKLLKDEWKRLKEKTQLMEEQKKLAKENERLQEWKEFETEKRIISRARMNYMERR